MQIKKQLPELINQWLERHVKEGNVHSCHPDCIHTACLMRRAQVAIETHDLINRSISLLLLRAAAEYVADPSKAPTVQQHMLSELRKLAKDLQETADEKLAKPH